MTCENGSTGWPEFAPFDRIIVTAAAPLEPAELLTQLANGGRLVCPIGPQNGDGQYLYLYVRSGESISATRLYEVRFVPLHV